MVKDKRKGRDDEDRDDNDDEIAKGAESSAKEPVPPSSGEPVTFPPMNALKARFRDRQGVAPDTAKREGDVLDMVFKDVATLGPGVIEKAFADINNAMLPVKLKGTYKAIVRRFVVHSFSEAAIQNCPPELLA